MGAMKTGPTLAIDHNVLFQLLQDPAFYRRVPVFHFMKDQALAVVERIVARAGLPPEQREGDCAACGSLRQEIAPLQQVFVAELRKLAADAPEALASLVDYVAARRGYRPVPVVVYFREADGSVGSVKL